LLVAPQPDTACAYPARGKEGKEKEDQASGTSERGQSMQEKGEYIRDCVYSPVQLNKLYFISSWNYY